MILFSSTLRAHCTEGEVERRSYCWVTLQLIHCTYLEAELKWNLSTALVSHEHALTGIHQQNETVFGSTVPLCHTHTDKPSTQEAQLPIASSTVATKLKTVNGLHARKATPPLTSF